MALVVFLRGANVSGHRTFRPSVLAQQLGRFDVVNVGAAGTFVVREPVRRSVLREELLRRLPFHSDVMICDGAALQRLVAMSPLSGEAGGSDIVRFVSVLARVRKASSPLPQQFPATGDWVVRIVGQEGCFVYGVHRREMRAIRHLAQLDRLFGVPATTRSWNTIVAVTRVLAVDVRSAGGGDGARTRGSGRSRRSATGQGKVER